MIVIKKVEIEGWQSVVKGLSKIYGKDYKDIIESETAEILGQSSKRKATKIAEKKSVVARLMPIGIWFVGYEGDKRSYTVKAGKAGLNKTTTYYLSNRLPNKVWDYILSKTKGTTKEHFGNIGLNKGQFTLIGDMLGLPEPSRGYDSQSERFVQLRSKRIKDKIKTRSVNQHKDFYIEFRSDVSDAIRFGGSAKALKSVMKARVKKFVTAIKKGTFREIKKRTRAYPLISK